MSLFDELSAICNPTDAKRFNLKLRLEQLEANNQLLLVEMNDNDTEIQTLKAKLNDLPQSRTHRDNTIVDGDDVPPFSFV